MYVKLIYLKMIKILSKIAQKLTITSNEKKLTESELKALQEELHTLDHMIPLEELCQKLNTHTQYGLTEEEADRLYREVGPNTLTPPKVLPEYIKFIKCMFHGFASLLWACALLCFVLCGVSLLTEGVTGGSEWLGFIITLICLFSGIAAYVQETKTTKVNKSLSY